RRPVAMELTSAGSRHVELATHNLTRGGQARWFWAAGIAAGLLVPGMITAALLAVGSTNPVLLALAGVAALAGLYAYESAFLAAGQSVPLS
ncbi:MAG: hypothetical protein OEY70_19270, partial [Acidimicrobiia bacterium]|nr:hypothetical protein [Acidimicrobiia bacterium]